MKSGSLNLGSADIDWRDAARAAARRSGMTLGEWIDDAVAERAARLRITSDQMSESEQVLAIAARLGALPLDDLAPRRPSNRIEHEPPPRGRQPNMRLLDAAVAHLGLAADRSAPVVPEARRAPAHSSDDVVDVARRISDLEEALERRRAGGRPAALLAPVESRLRRIAESLLEDIPATHVENLCRIEARLEQMAAHFENPPPARRPRQEPLREEIGALRTQIEDLSRAISVIGERAGRSRLEPALLDLLSRIEASRSEGVSEAALAPILHALVDLREMLEQTPATAARALGDELADLKRRLATVERGEDVGAITALRHQVETLARHLADLVMRLSGREGANDSLHDQIAQLAERVEEIAAAPRRLTESLVAVIEDLRVSIEQIDSSPGFRMLERRIEDLAARQTRPTPDVSRALVDVREAIDSLSEHPAVVGLQAQLTELAQITVELPRNLFEPLDELRRAIETMAANPALGPELRAAPLPGQIVESLADIRLSLEKLAATTGVRLADDQAQRLQNIESRVTEISEKLDAPPIIERIAGLQESVLARIDRLRSEMPGEHMSALRSRMEDVHRAVSQPSLPPSLPPPGFLDDIVNRLAVKLEHVASVGAQDPRALQAIENQVLRIAERLDRHGETSEAIGTLERSIGDLFSKVEDTQSVDPQVRETISRDLSLLREMQDETDRRTRTTLEAVHETLEKVVDRLAMLESDVGGLRAAPREHAAPEPVAAANIDPPSLKAETPAPRAEHPAPTADATLSVQTEHAAPAIVVERADTVLHALPARQDASLDMALEMSEPRAAQKSFIAAARRATRLMGGSPPPPPRVENDEGSAAQRAHAATTQDRATFTDASRKMIVGVAGLILTMGAYQLIGDETPPASPVAPQAAPNRPDSAIASPAVAASPSDAQSLDPFPVATIARPDSALAILRELAMSGHPAAQFEIASRLVEGRGLGRDAPQAVRWLEKAAQQNYAPAQYRLAALYEKGAGVERSPKEAMRWYASAADAGHVRAMHNLGVLLADGVDARPDYVTAAAMFRRAAEFGLRDSQYNLAVLYVRGLGVEINLLEAYKFFSLASAQGDIDALNRRDEIAARMLPKQMSDARRAVETFARRTPEPGANEPPPFDAIVGARSGAVADQSPMRAKADSRISLQ
ncbi:MAG: peptidoglycan-binding protein [Hyphomicrobiales bacterium]|nr:peptidoglycan-binding protein [Hyphomicrobiales bacterium]